MTNRLLIDPLDFDLLVRLDSQEVYGPFLPSREERPSSRLRLYYDWLGKGGAIEDSKLLYRVKRLIDKGIISPTSLGGNPGCSFISEPTLNLHWTNSEKGKKILERTLLLDSCCGGCCIVPVESSSQIEVANSVTDVVARGRTQIKIGGKEFVLECDDLEVPRNLKFEVKVETGTTEINGLLPALEIRFESEDINNWLERKWFRQVGYYFN